MASSVNLALRHNLGHLVRCERRPTAARCLPARRWHYRRWKRYCLYERHYQRDLRQLSRRSGAFSTPRSLGIGITIPGTRWKIRAVYTPDLPAWTFWATTARPIATVDAFTRTKQLAALCP